MKKMILCVIAMSSMFLASCDDYVSRKRGVIMVGNKPYKLISGTLDGSYFKIIVPADSSVSIIADNVTYTSGKKEETVLYVK